MESCIGRLKRGASVYFIGIKGTGVCALAELASSMGLKVKGSDTTEQFYTDEILQGLGIPYHETFEPAHISGDIDLVIHSAAYSGENNAELAEARRKSIPIVSYAEALGAHSAAFDSTGVAGVHGKTTTTAMCGCLIKGLGLPAQALVGSAVANFNGRSTIALGNKYFVAETCEYRKHFLSFHPKRIILTAVESDHQDFFPTYESIRGAFVEYCRLIPPGGELIYCADDPGASEVAGIIENENRGISLIPYGFNADGYYRVRSYHVEDDRAVFTIAGFPEELRLRVPGRHQALNAAAALAFASVLIQKESGGWNEPLRIAAAKALEEFSGSKRRSEIIGSAGGVIFMDDYGHHPTAIQTTLEGLRSFYPSRRLIVSFMSHTYTRTAALLDDFAGSLAAADVLVLHKIYASAREHFDGKVSGESIYEKINSWPDKKADTIIYIDEPMDAVKPLKEILKPGDLFLTLGAGSNWPLGLELYRHYHAGHCQAVDGAAHD
ncbi:MAG: UDP-N-acetylmuramate--L-alanine ligase [Treponema sp.]|jgi:UDP-N-acetylmuramate--alanine ligase|nr:UDP-N-acetylmuramate--L-alanine ligase [Treponema sp.]